MSKKKADILDLITTYAMTAPLESVKTVVTVIQSIIRQRTPAGEVVTRTTRRPRAAAPEASVKNQTPPGPAVGYNETHLRDASASGGK